MTWVEFVTGHRITRLTAALLTVHGQREAEAETPVRRRTSPGCQDCFNTYVADVYQAIAGPSVPDCLTGFPDEWRSGVLVAAVLKPGASWSGMEIPA